MTVRTLFAINLSGEALANTLRTRWALTIYESEEIAALFAELLEGENERLRGINEDHCRAVNTLTVDGAQLTAQRDALQAEVEALRGAVEKAADLMERDAELDAEDKRVEGDWRDFHQGRERGLRRAASDIRRALEGEITQSPWKNVPAQYAGRWSYTYDEKGSVFFVHCNGHRICDAEDSEVAHAICLAHNSKLRAAREGRSALGEEGEVG